MSQTDCVVLVLFLFRRAKTDVYVGFLPAEALERLLERRPIVLLTLAKRLISLLSPLGTSSRLAVPSGLQTDQID